MAAQARLSRPVFTADSRFVVFSIEPAKADLNKAKKDKKRPDDMPRNALGIMDLSSGQVARVERVKSFQVPEDGSGVVAYLRKRRLRTHVAVALRAKAETRPSGRVQVQTRPRLNHPHPAAELLLNHHAAKKRNTAPI
jgi:hypothetical protein